MEEGQAVTQPTEAINPHEAVAYLAEAIEQQETQETRPRDEKGKFTKPASEEAQPEGEAAEQPAEEAAPESEETAQETQEEAQPARKLKLKYKGEEREVEESEAVELAQKGYDYSQKTAALAQERAELASKAKAAEEAARKQYETQLQTYEQIVLKLADQEALTADLAKVAAEDPAKALQLSIKRSQIAETINAVRGEQQRLAQSRQAEMQEALQKQAREAVEILKSEIPGWSNDLYGKILKTAIDQYGYKDHEVNAITDPRAIKVLDDARKWRESQAKPKTVEKRVATVPKVVKPGTAEKPDSKAAKIKGLDEALTKTGSRQAAQELVLQMLADNRL